MLIAPPSPRCFALCESACLLAVVYTGRCNLSFPVCICVSVHVLLTQDSAGWSRCKLVTQTHGCCRAGPSNAPLCGQKLDPSSAFCKQTQPPCVRPTRARRHTTLSMKRPHTHSGSVERQPDSRIYYVMTGAVILLENFTFAYAIPADIIGNFI